MNLRSIARIFVAAVIVVMAILPAPAATASGVTEGRLDAVDPEGKPLGPCPLKHTDVNVEIAGFIARVTVRQQFHNPFRDKIEAVYVFPLSQDAAVDRMTMTVGDREIKGEIKELGRAKSVNLIIGTIEVGKLTTLAEVKAVRRVIASKD